MTDTPAADRHAAVLTGLDRLETTLASASPSPWRWLDQLPPDASVGPGSGLVTAADDLPPADVEAILTLRNSAAAVLAGRRRIVERHAPNNLGSRITYCGDAPHLDDLESWPCDDYRDAAADLLPEGDTK